MVGQFTAKTTSSEKPTYFLSLMSCSTNKLKSHMLFTCKNFMFSDFTWKKHFLLQEMWDGGRGADVPPGPPFSRAPKVERNTKNSAAGTAVR